MSVPRRRVAAGLAALALIGSSVFAVSLSAAAYAPTEVTLDALGSGTQVGDALVGMSGTADHGGGGDQSIEVYVSADGGADQLYCTAELTIYDPVAAGVPWSCSSFALAALPYGELTFWAQSFEYATPGEVSPRSNEVTLSVGSADPPTIASPADGTSTTDATPTFTGTGPELGTVSVRADGTEICSSPVASDGSWSCTSTPLQSYVPDPLAWEITYVIDAVGTDLDGGSAGTSPTQTITIQIPDTPTIDETFSPWYTSNPTPEVQGNKGLYSNQVIVWRSTDGVSWWYYCLTPADELATIWFCNAAEDSVADELDYGVNYLAAAAVNDSGQLSTLGPSITIYRLYAPTFAQPSSPAAATNDPTPTFSGTADPLTTAITVRDGSGTICSGAVTAGAWSCTPVAPLADGTYSYFAWGPDPSPGAFSETFELTIDTVAPIDPTVVTSGTVFDTTPVITGAGEAGAAVTVYVDGAPAACATPAVVDDGGDWSCELASPLTEGTHSIGAVQTDAAGNPSTVGVPASSSTITVSAPPVPPTPTITTSPGTVYSAQRFISGTIDNSLAQEYVVEVTATWSGGSDSCQWTVAYFETDWSCLVELGSGTNTITATAWVQGDPGNPSVTSAPLTLTRATLAKPAITYSLGPASIGYTVSGDPAGDVSVSLYCVTVGAGYGYSLYQPGLGCTEGGEGGGDEGGEGASSEFAAASLTESAGSLPPGIYNVYANQTVDGATSEYRNDFVMIPSAPTLAASATEGAATFSGAGTPGYLVIVRDSGAGTVCSAVVTASAQWSCSAALPAGTATVDAIQRSQGFVADTGSIFDVPDASIQGYSAATGPVSVVVPAAPAPDPEPTASPAPSPTPTPAFQAWTFTFGMGGDSFAPGDSTTLTGSGLPAGAAVDAELHSTPVFLGSTTVAADGSFGLAVTIPEDVEPGQHEFVVTVTPIAGTGMPAVQRQAVTILDPPRGRAEPTRDEVAAALPLVAGESTDRSDPAAPSSLTTALEPAQAVLTNPIVIGGAALAGIVLLLLVALPAELLNQTVSENYERITRRMPRVRAPWWQRLTTWLNTTPLVGGIAITAIAALIFGFVDPGFGWDVTSLRLVLACGLALFVVGYIASSISGAIIRRTWGLETVMELKPLGLVLAAVGVLLSRLIEFSPGFLIGLILGITVLSTTDAAQRAKVTLVQAGTVLSLSLLGWAAYSILFATTTPDTFVTALAFEATAAITVEGLTALVIGMLPFKALDGAEVAEHSKWLWAGVWAFIAAVWFLIVVPSAWGEYSGPLWTWVAVLAGFAVVAVAVYLFFRFTAGNDEPEDDPTTAVDESEVEDVVL